VATAKVVPAVTAVLQSHEKAAADREREAQQKQEKRQREQALVERAKRESERKAQREQEKRAAVLSRKEDFCVKGVFPAPPLDRAALEEVVREKRLVQQPTEAHAEVVLLRDFALLVGVASVTERVNARKRERDGDTESTAEPEVAKRARRANRWAQHTVEHHLPAGASMRWKESCLKAGDHQKGEGPWVCRLEDLLDAYAPTPLIHDPLIHEGPAPLDACED
jgi:hypothetical protein